MILLYIWVICDTIEFAEGLDRATGICYPLNFMGISRGYKMKFLPISQLTVSYADLGSEFSLKNRVTFQLTVQILPDHFKLSLIPTLHAALLVIHSTGLFLVLELYMGASGRLYLKDENKITQ